MNAKMPGGDIPMANAVVKSSTMALTRCFSLFIEKLNNNLRRSLPGEAAHRIMEARSANYLNIKPDEQTRKSAVLILLYPVDNQAYFPLILRQRYAGCHSGEVSFPGGRYELTDETLINTALREANEEIGLVVDDVKVLGTLTEIFIATSNFLVLPVIGYIPYRPQFVLNTREVNCVFEVDLNCFLNPENTGVGEILIPGETVLTPHYEVEGNKIWGATAKMIIELLLVLGDDS